ncbi:hypothetical protein BD779DRAFT_662705 [Infundibulicybe gibba]|nr:hypothetical protein BD779DRAFT_662705 [Infundibulicybe gibba]
MSGPLVVIFQSSVVGEQISYPVRYQSPMSRDRGRTCVPSEGVVLWYLCLDIRPLGAREDLRALGTSGMTPTGNASGTPRSGLLKLGCENDLKHRERSCFCLINTNVTLVFCCSLPSTLTDPDSQLVFSGPYNQTCAVASTFADGYKLFNVGS